MNVWLWGPPMWDTLHKAAYVCDMKGISAKPIMQTLTVLLPCKYCRNSYNDFYDDLGPPAVGRSSSWIHKVHGLVNHKLALQRLDAFLSERQYPKEIIADLKANLDSFAYSEPTLEVIQKRNALYAENLFHLDYILVFLIAIATNVNTNSTRKESDTKVLLSLIRGLVVCAQAAGQTDIVDILEGIRPGSILSDLEYQKNGKYNISKLMQAKACSKGSCA